MSRQIHAPAETRTSRSAATSKPLVPRLAAGSRAFPLEEQAGLRPVTPRFGVVGVRQSSLNEQPWAAPITPQRSAIPHTDKASPARLPRFHMGGERGSAIHRFPAPQLTMNREFGDTIQHRKPPASPAPRFHHEVPVAPFGNLQPGRTNARLEDAVSSLGSGQPVPTFLRGPMRSAGAQAPDRVRVHDNKRSHVLSRLLGNQAFAVGNNIVMGAPETADRPRDWLVSHEAGHTIQQEKDTASTTRTADQSALEQEADMFADWAATPARNDRKQPGRMSRGAEGMANRVIWKYKQGLPGDLMLILDVDDGGFIGGCVKQYVPHVGAKLVRKGVSRSGGNVVMNIHLGIMRNAAGRRCVFFYESVSGICKTLCTDDVERVLRSLAQIAAWILLAALLIGLAYLAAVALAAAAAPALAAAAAVLVAMVAVSS